MSIVVVSFNQARYLPATLESIEAQDFKDFEIILIDDASEDDSAIVSLNWAKLHSLPLVVIQNVRNRGLVPTLAAATSLVRTPLFSLIAADDLLEPRKLSTQVPLLVDGPPAVGFVYSDALLISDDGRLVGDTWLQRFVPGITPKDGDLFEDFLLRGFHVPAMSYLIRTEVLRRSGAFGAGLEFEDIDLNLRLSYRAEGRFSDYPSVRYRLRPDGLRSTLSPEAFQRTLFYVLRPWLDHPLRTRSKVRQRYLLEAYWLYEHQQIAAPELLAAVRDAPSVVTVLLVFFALLRVPRRDVVAGYAYLGRLAKRFRTVRSFVRRHNRMAFKTATPSAHLSLYRHRE